MAVLSRKRSVNYEIKEFTRQLRFLPEMPAGEKNIESSPSMPQKPEISWLTVFLLPLIMNSVTVIISLSAQYSRGVVILIITTNYGRLPRIGMAVLTPHDHLILMHCNVESIT
jgi:hypothetical protein